ncbi:MAG TPA: hypothetical protein VHY82_15970 [Acetobacteraceae bacterium]|jgi:hypothetical protein|nr:hypothetical protein [Acetobacteraceae bacterium]
MTTPTKILADVKAAIRSKYAWPGGYPLYIVMQDGEALSIDAAREHFEQICRATLLHERNGWAAAGSDINYEDPALFCAHTGERIESAYAEDEANADQEPHT